MKGYTTAGVGFMGNPFFVFGAYKKSKKEGEWMVCINGESKTGYDGMTLPDVLEKEKYDIKRIAVEINGEIISRSLFSETVVHSGDHLEVVSFVGGG